MDEIRSTKSNGIMTLLLNRPSKRNAITRQMYAALADGLSEATDDFDIRAVVIGAEGPTFTAGNDISDFASDPQMDEGSPVFRFIYGLHNFPKPLIAGVSGRAVGIGTTMLLHCDLVTASHDALFSMPFVNLGLVPEAGSSFLFPRLVGHARASEIFLTGRDFNAEEAHQMGLVNQLSTNPLEAATNLAEKIASQPPNAIINTKALLKSASHEALNHVIRVEGELFRLAIDSPEAQEAFMKFLTKNVKL